MRLIFVYVLFDCHHRYKKVKKPDEFIIKNANGFYCLTLNNKAINLLLGIVTLENEVVFLKTDYFFSIFITCIKQIQNKFNNMH